MINLSAWPEGSRLILRKERPRPGAQATFTDVDGHRITAFLTGTPPGVIGARSPGWNCGGPPSRPGVEDRGTCPAGARRRNSAWLEAVLAAADLVCWAKLICFAHVPSLARCEIAAFRYRVLHVAAQLTRLRPEHPAAHRPHLAVGRPDRGRFRRRPRAAFA